MAENTTAETENVMIKKATKKQSESLSKCMDNPEISFSTEVVKTTKNTTHTPSYHGEAMLMEKGSSTEELSTEPTSTGWEHKAATGASKSRKVATPVNVKRAIVKSSKYLSRINNISTTSNNTSKGEKQRKKIGTSIKRKINFDDAIKDIVQTKKKKTVTHATNEDAQPNYLMCEEELREAYEEDLRAEAECEEEQYVEEARQRWRHNLATQTEFNKRQNKATELWKKIQKHYDDKQFAIGNDVYKDMTGTFRCNYCFNRCNIHGIHWNARAQKYNEKDCHEDDETGDEATREKKQTLTIDVEKQDEDEELVDRDGIFAYDYSPNLIYIIRGFVQYIMKD